MSAMDLQLQGLSIDDYAALSAFVSIRLTNAVRSLFYQGLIRVEAD